MEVYKQGADYKAEVVWFRDAKDTITPPDQRYNKRNPDPLLRKQKLPGLDVLKYLAYDAREKNGLMAKFMILHRVSCEMQPCGW